LRAQSRFLRVVPLTICRLARCQAVRCRVGPCRDSLRIRCRIRGLIRRYVRLKRLGSCWCLVKQIYGALIGANTVRLNSGATGNAYPKGCFGHFLGALEPTKESGIGGYMPSYISEGRNISAPLVCTSLSCARCSRSSLLFRFDSTISFHFSRSGLGTSWVLAQLTAAAEIFLLELISLIDRVIVGQVVDSFPRP
jgi:hypothetical protein